MLSMVFSLIVLLVDILTLDLVSVRRSIGAYFSEAFFFVYRVDCRHMNFGISYRKHSIA